VNVVAHEYRHARQLRRIGGQGLRLLVGDHLQAVFQCAQIAVGRLEVVAHGGGDEAQIR
jgi:hypothetical protein